MNELPAGIRGTDSSESVGGRFRWIGPGSTGFLLPCDEKRGLPCTGWSRPIRAGSPVEVREAVGPCYTEKHDVVFRCFFEAGGGECRVLPVPAEPRHWLGENGGPGERTGIYAFLDLEDVGCVVVPPVTPRRLEDFLAFAERYEGMFLFTEEKSRRRPRQTAHLSHRNTAPEEHPIEFSRPLPNLLLMKKSEHSGCTSAALAAHLEWKDPVLWRSSGARPRRRANHFRGMEKSGWAGMCTHHGGDLGGRVAWTLDRESLKPLQLWRLASGVRRSLDHGSRWVLFEPSHPIVWRRLEREARAFVHDLSLEGVLTPWGGRGLDIRCEPSPEDGGRVVFIVRTRIARSELSEI